MEKITQIKNIQQKPGRTPYIYFDMQLFELLGWKPKEAVQVQFDIENHQVCISKAPAEAQS